MKTILIIYKWKDTVGFRKIRICNNKIIQILNMKIESLEMSTNSQQLFDCFNGFMMSSDKRVFNKLIARTLLYESIKNVPGDIVECGVFKGTGLYTFLKLKNISFQAYQMQLILHLHITIQYPL